jgi:glutamate racemase
MASASSPILVLDSGLGGLTVIRALRRAMPMEHILYFGDTARVPYGTKSAGTVTTFVRQIIQYLHHHEPKHVVFACNTATALSLQALRAEFPHLSMSGVIEPGARAAVEAAGQKLRPMIGIVGTDATIRSRAYERAIVRRRQHARILSRSTPLLVPIIEEGRAQDDPLVKLAIQQYLAPLIERQIDVLVLGCTHYPIYKQAIVQALTPGVPVIDSAERCAEDVLRRLRTARLERQAGAAGSLRCFVTDDAPRFAMLASRFLGIQMDLPAWVSLDDLHAATMTAGSALSDRVELQEAV